MKTVVQQLETVIAENEALTAQVDTAKAAAAHLIRENTELKGQLAASVNHTALEAAIAERDSARADLAAERDAHGQTREALNQARNDTVIARNGFDLALEGERKAHADTRARLQGAEAILRNPAFCDVMRGAKTATDEGGMPSDEPEMTAQEAHRRYNAMANNTRADAAALADFRRRHWKVLGIDEEK